MGVIFSIDGEEDRHDEGAESDGAQDDEGSDEEGSDEGSDDDAGGGEGDESDDSDEGDGKGKGKGKEDEVDDDEEAPVRKPKTPADFVALRRGKKIEKMSKSKDDGKGQGGDGDDDDDGDDADDDKDPRSIAQKEVAKALKPFAERLEQEEVETEIATFIQENPDFKPFAKKVEKWSKNEAWRGVPIDRIFYAAAGKDLLRIGAERRKEADKGARKGRTGGGSSGGDGEGARSWDNAPLEDVGKEIERIKQGERR